jgi:flagellin-like hook-associated protein FlgL
MALNETGTTVNSRASVEVPETGNYRFVFIVGTHDKTGGLLAGADMVIDNIVAEEPYTISTGAVSDILKAIHFENNANAANPNKTLVTKVSNQDGTTVLTDDALITMQNFALTSEPDGPYMLAPTLDFTTQPSEGGTGSATVLTKKIETVQERLNLARTQAGSQYGTLEEAINITTDLRSQFALGSGTLSDLNFSIETVNLTRRQMQQDVATTVLAQANTSQSSLVSLVDGSYRNYLNS